MMQVLPFYDDGAIRTLRAFEALVYQNLSVDRGPSHHAAQRPHRRIHRGSHYPTAVEYP